MGNPLHYSLELPQRCLQLIEELWPCAERTWQPGRSSLGPLTTTFLISMSMPIITLPVERIERHQNDNGQGYADDRDLNRRLAEAVITVLGGHPLDNRPSSFPMRGASHSAIQRHASMSPKRSRRTLPKNSRAKTPGFGLLGWRPHNGVALCAMRWLMEGSRISMSADAAVMIAL
jgi:hypothetical protein